jgi:hypothetical protein
VPCNNAVAVCSKADICIHFVSWSPFVDEIAIPRAKTFHKLWKTSFIHIPYQKLGITNPGVYFYHFADLFSLTDECKRHLHAIWLCCKCSWHHATHRSILAIFVPPSLFVTSMKQNLPIFLKVFPSNIFSQHVHSSFSLMRKSLICWLSHQIYFRWY